MFRLTADQKSKKMKTKLYLIIMTIFCLGFLISCGGGNGDGINADEILPHPSFTSIGKSGNRHIVVGTDGRIFTAENNGVSLVAKESGTMRDLHRVIFRSNNNVVYIIGDGGVFIKSDNGGASFVLQPSFSSEDLIAGEFGSELTTLYVASREGSVFRSDNSGVDWTKVGSLPSGVVPRSLLFNDDNTGWIVGAHGIIYKTVNSGVDWVEEVSGTSRNLNSITAGPSHSLWVVGDGGTVIDTSDGGTTWVAKDVGGTTADINFIGFLNIVGGGHPVFPCYLIGDGAVIRSDYAGTNWVNLAPSENLSNYHDFIGFPLTVIGENDVIFQITQNALPPLPQQN